MRLVVASGKGGTGKTLVAANLAAVISLEREVVLADCDVEEPNLHLFFPAGEKTLPVMTDVPVFDSSRCTHCGKCADFCQYGAIVVLKERFMFFPEMCHGCGGCELVCPEGAIILQKRPLGHVAFSRPRPGVILISGVMNEREVMSPHVIRETLNYTSGHPVVICDAPPGTACPLVETLEGADACIFVTEPTPFGRHDLALAAGVAEVLGVPAGVVINRSMGEDEIILDFCRSRNLPVFMTIPFDRGIAETANGGQLVTDGMPELSAQFKELFGKVCYLAGVK
ncbi:MAG: ATP-binding protein [Methanolinea sp.]|jgi:MinD superfamily P-loop ATPase|nr:ATP-binding protein [Methanolinea sp.]